MDALFHAMRQLPQGIICDVILVDDGSTLSINEQSLPSSVQLVRLRERQAAAAARNAGLALARGEVVLFLDADTCLAHELRNEVAAELIAE
jgi:glycosyltransferase involved in cell wall biosynthesis